MHAFFVVVVVLVVVNLFRQKAKPMIDPMIRDVRLPATGGKELALSDFLGQPLVVYFYPKDSTPGCTSEAQQFRDLYPEFSAAGCALLGVSRDSVRSHENFRSKQALPFDLISDADETLCAAFSVIKMKTLYGKQVRGIERSTFVIDRAGTLSREWRAVKTSGHAQEVLEFVKTLA